MEIQITDGWEDPIEVPRHQFEYVAQILSLVAKHEALANLWVWKDEKGGIKFNINTNDFFAWACADAEPVTLEDITMLEECLTLAGDDGPLLFVARKNNMRPQGACYAFLSEKNWHLFDDCGPYREPGFGNPVDRNKIHEYIAQRRQRRQQHNHD